MDDTEGFVNHDTYDSQDGYASPDGAEEAHAIYGSFFGNENSGNLHASQEVHLSPTQHDPYEQTQCFTPYQAPHVPSHSPRPQGSNRSQPQGVSQPLSQDGSPLSSQVRRTTSPHLKTQHGSSSSKTQGATLASQPTQSKTPMGSGTDLGMSRLSGSRRKRENDDALVKSVETLVEIIKTSNVAEKDFANEALDELNGLQGQGLLDENLYLMSMQAFSLHPQYNKAFLKINGDALKVKFLETIIGKPNQ